MIIYIFLIVTLVLLLLGLLFILYRHSRTLHELQMLKEQNKKMKENSDARSAKSLAKVQEETEEIILQANKKAADLLAEAKLFSSDERELLQHKLSGIVDGQVEAFSKINELLNKEYQAELDKTKKEAIDLFNNVSQSINETANKEIIDFKTTLEEQTVNSEKMVTDRIEEAYKKVSDEIADYKKNKLAEVDQTAGQRMHEIANYVLGNGLSIDQQEVLIQSALQELKKQSGQ